MFKVSFNIFFFQWSSALFSESRKIFAAVQGPEIEPTALKCSQCCVKVNRGGLALSLLREKEKGYERT